MQDDKIKRKDILNCESAVNEIIGMILLLAIGVSMLALTQSQSVPEWNKELEFSHFNDLYDDFLDMRQVIQEVPAYDQPGTALLHTDLDYPPRMFLINPSSPSADFTAFLNKQVWITYYSNGTGPVMFNATSCTLRINESYNYFQAPALVLEHGMIIGDTGHVNYTINAPLMTNNSMDVLLINCDNTSIASTAALNLQVYPVGFNSTTVNNVSISFSTDHPALWIEYFNSTGMNWTSSGNIVTVNYYNTTKLRIINSSVG